jgi:hypothetical protein
MPSELTRVFATTEHGDGGAPTGRILLKARTEQNGMTRSAIVAELDAVEAAHLIGDLAVCLERLATAPVARVRAKP